MAVATLSFITTKLGSLLLEEADLLTGLKDDIQWIKCELESMQSFLRDADRKKDTDESVSTWVQQVRDVAYDAEDIVDEFLLRTRKPRDVRFMGSLLRFLHSINNLFPHHQIAKKIQRIKARVGAIYERSQRYKFEKLEDVKSVDESSEMLKHYRELHPLMVEDHEIVGIEKPKEQLLNWLIEGNSRLTGISVVGMGGLGKTTLVRKAYASAGVRKHFDCHAWITGSRSIRIRGLLKELVSRFFEEAGKGVPDEIAAKDDARLVEMLNNFLRGKRYVLVLDDSWSLNVWSTIKYAMPDDYCGSRIIVTTRIGNVASSIETFGHVLHLQPLCLDDSWALFCRKVFRSNTTERECPQELEALSQSIVKRCGGLPLAIVALGGLMAKTEKTLVEWNRVHDSLSWEFSSSETFVSVRSVLLLSYDNLPNYLKPCFLYCSIFPTDSLIFEKRIIMLWIAEGFVEGRKGLTMEEIGEVYLRELIDRSMLQVEATNDSGRVKACRVHDLMRELALSILEKENFCAICNRSDPNVLTRIRRLSIHEFKGDVPWNTSMSNIRSFFFFGLQICSSSLLTSLLTCKLLRVLDLEGSSIEKLPHELFELFHLRYLGLRKTNISKIPSSLSMLVNLQTLDIRKTGVESLPHGLYKLQNLRHLYLNTVNEVYPIRLENTRGVKVPLGVVKLRNLQTLAFVESIEGLARALASLTQLKRLEVLKMRKEDGNDLCTAINNMNSLLNLSVFAINENEPLQLETLVHPSPFLRYVILGGSLEKLPHWFDSLRSLTKLRLFWSRLKEDPFFTLQALPNLAYLSLSDAYDGPQLYCEAGGFPSLKFLLLDGLKKLECVKVEEGSMPKICKLWIFQCDGLQMVPYGIEYLKSLENLVLVDMPHSFISEGEDYRKVQHIHNITHVFHSDGN